MLEKTPARRLFSLALEYAHMPARMRRRILGNPAPVNKKHKHTPKHHPVSIHQEIVAYCHQALKYAGKMTYDEGPERSMLFHRKPGDFGKAHADCSQLVASILHWCGVKAVTDTDYTGTLLQKGKHAKTPAAGRVAIWGPGTGAHAAFVTTRHGDDDWYVVGFGHQGAPDRVLLTDMDHYFVSVGEPGVRFLEFTR